MKTAFALALVAGASAQFTLDGMLPFLMMDGLGGGSYYYGPSYGHGSYGHHGRAHRSYYSRSSGLGDIGMIAALGGLGGGAGLTPTNAAYLVASQNGGFGDNLPLLAASGAFGENFLAGNSALPLLAAGGFGGSSNSMALLAATGGVGGVDSSAMMLPLMVNSMAYGRSPSLSRDVIPAMALTGQPITTQSLLPFMMTSGGRYLGGNAALLAATGGLGGVSSEAMMPWLLADSYGSSYYAPRHHGLGHGLGHVGHARPAYHAGHGLGHGLGHVGHAAPLAPRAIAPRTVLYSTAAPVVTTV